METDFRDLKIQELQHIITLAREQLQQRATKIDSLPFIDTSQNKFIRERSSMLNEY